VMAREERSRRRLLEDAASNDSLQLIKSLLMLGQGTRLDQVPLSPLSLARAFSLIYSRACSLSDSLSDSLSLSLARARVRLISVISLPPCGWVLTYFCVVCRGCRRRPSLG